MSQVLTLDGLFYPDMDELVLAGEDNPLANLSKNNPLAICRRCDIFFFKLLH